MLVAGTRTSRCSLTWEQQVRGTSYTCTSLSAFSLDFFPSLNMFVSSAAVAVVTKDICTWVVVEPIFCARFFPLKGGWEIKKGADKGLVPLYG